MPGRHASRYLRHRRHGTRLQSSAVNRSTAVIPANLRRGVVVPQEEQPPMSRINPVDRDTTHEGVRRNFDTVEKQLGVVPNMMRTMAVSPAVLEGYLGLSAALRRGALRSRCTNRSR